MPWLVVLAAALLAGGDAQAAWRQDRFLIGGWIPGPWNHAAALTRLDDAGLDYIHSWYPSAAECRTVAGRLDSLSRARPGFDLRLIAHIRVPFDDPGRLVDNPDPVGNWGRIRPVVERIARAGGTSVLGWHLADEPFERAALRKSAAAARLLRSLPATADQLAYVNLLPRVDPADNGAYAAEFGRAPDAAFAAYLDAYLAAFEDAGGAPVLSFDHYPFQRSSRPAAAWFRTLALVRDAVGPRARVPSARGVPFWVIVQASNFRPRGGVLARHLTPAMVRWQAWSAVAYGAKGIAYWTLSPAEDQFNHIGFGGGILDGAGQPTPLLAEITRLNAELHALGPTLLELEGVGVRHVDAGGQAGLEGERWTSAGGAPNPLGPVAAVEAGTGRADALVALLRHSRSGEDYVFVLNKSLTRARTFRLRLAAPVSRVERIRRSDGRAETVARGAASFPVASLAAGSGELFRLVD